jgi:hypothetical protein
MPLITLDTSVALPAALKAGSVPRKLWVVLAYGALTYQVEHLRLDRDELVQLAAAEGGEVLATGALDEMIESAERRRTVLGELLPYGTPSDCVAVGFASLFNEFERKVRQADRKFDPELRPEDAEAIRRQFGIDLRSGCSAVPADGPVGAYPRPGGRPDRLRGARGRLRHSHQ